MSSLRLIFDMLDINAQINNRSVLTRISFMDGKE